MLKYVIIALTLHASVEGYLRVILEEEKPTKFAGYNGCYFPNYDRMLRVDVPFIPLDGMPCEMYVCKENKLIYFEGCSNITVLSDSCQKIPANLSQPYPDCCEKIICTLSGGHVFVTV